MGSHWVPTQKGPVLSLMLSLPVLRPIVAPLKFLIFEQGTPHFYFALAPVSRVISPANRVQVLRVDIWGEGWVLPLSSHDTWG